MAKYTLYQSHHIHNIREMLEQSVSAYGTLPAFYQKTEGEYKAFTYAKFKSDVDALGTELCARGFGGARVIVLGENSYRWCVSYMTVIAGLGTVIPVDKEIPAEEVANIARISEASLILYSQKYTIKTEYLDKSVECISFDELDALIEMGLERIGNGEKAYRERSIDIDAMSVLIFTSGTTGVSKGVMLSQRNLCTNLENVAKMISVSPADTALSVLPLHHVYECTCGFLFPLSRGASVAFSESVRHIMSNAREIQPTKMLCVPLLIETMYRKIWTNIRKKGIEEKVKTVIRLTNRVKPYAARMALKKKMFAEIHKSFGGKLDLLVSGGAPIDPQVLRGMRDFGFHIIQGYGLTEAAPLAAVNHDTYFLDRSAGLALPGGELRIDSPAEDGTGEICYRGDNVMLGYFGRQDLTDEIKKNGWLYTGDLGYIDENGFLIITGRKKNVIVTAGGKNIFPEELEAYLMRDPAVAECVVIGVINEKKNDYDIVACIRPDLAYVAETMGKDATDEKIAQRLDEAVKKVNATVQTYKHIHGTVMRQEEFPKSSSKKIKRFEVAPEIEAAYLSKQQ
ncbi:MAG: long-chain fatty acid--CoA ligase [Ruminococcaceae bacterium]|nr:long-chain fatty acid--CoA ligase [Oscillospiraceae bacterium]